ncbi:hypothetical protein F5887DRAFT_976144 [Amanita rubescens]|nr:hypothetical protein F5887DRAFT_976144 [Amanita rubescens]
MGIAAGGQIQQKIYKDNKPANIYDEDACERVWIHTVSTDLWELDTPCASASPPRSSDLPDPTNPPHCSTHSNSQSGCVFRPCGHYGCEGCVGRVIMGGNECPVCGQAVARMVGFKKPIPRVNVGAGSEGDWWSVEEKIEGIPVHAKSEAASVITLILNEDNVSRLSGTTL